MINKYNWWTKWNIVKYDDKQDFIIGLCSYNITIFFFSDTNYVKYIIYQCCMIFDL